MAAFGNPTTAERGIARYLTNKQCNRSAPSRSTRRIRKTFGSALVNRGRATACPLATESTSPPMAANHGRALAWRNRNASHGLRLIQETATRCSPRFPARCGAIRPTAVCTKQPMAARRGSKSSRARIFRPVAPMSRLIRVIPISCLPRCGISGAKAGNTARAAQFRRRLQPVDCSVRPMVAILGRRLQSRLTKVSQRNRMDAWRWRSRHRNRNAFTRLSNRRRARCSFPTTAARHGRNATKASGWSGVRSISRT